MKVYKVNVTQEGKWWMVSIPELDELTQAHRLDEAEQMARECIAVTVGASVDDIAVEITCNQQ